MSGVKLEESLVFMSSEFSDSFIDDISLLNSKVELSIFPKINLVLLGELKISVTLLTRVDNIRLFFLITTSVFISFDSSS